MGIDYIQLNPIPTPVFPLEIGKDDDGWPAGDGGGANATFVQENGTVNDLPGRPNSPETNQQADNDYYFAGVYTNVIAANGAYEPVGIVPRNEEAAERAFAGEDNDLRYHFNLPATLRPTNQITITFDALNLHVDDTVTDPHYGIEIYFNGVLVQPQLIIRTNQLGISQTTAPFTLATVNAQTGLGTDNIVTLKGINYSADGGGNWMGIDYVRIEPLAEQKPQFTSITSANGRITLNWTGGGVLESAPAITGQWTANATASAPYSEAIVAGQNRFYRLRR
jgi:hypothetical protein